MNKKNQIILRFAIAFIVGIAITGICLNVTWQSAGVYIQFPQKFTRKTLKHTALAIEEYRKKKGTLPHSLRQLSSMPDAPMIQETGAVWDSWRHPLVYEVDKNSFTLMSYGRDGKPGGIGLDCDLSSINPEPAAAALPFLQVMFYPSAQPMVIMSFFSGIMAFLLILVIVKPVDLSREKLIELAFKLIVTLIATYFVAITITLLHVPSGH